MAQIERSAHHNARGIFYLNQKSPPNEGLFYLFYFFYFREVLFFAGAAFFFSGAAFNAGTFVVAEAMRVSGLVDGSRTYTYTNAPTPKPSTGPRK
jgi:hypothetical protein